jgi:TetR/AcrR family transcriptional regulator, cholesterol catabolism regulator
VRTYTPPVARTRKTPAETPAPDNGATPLGKVAEILKRAEERGELTANETEWSIARLSGKVRAGNPRVEGVDRRDSIVRAAIAVFRREGYSHSTIEMIANELLLTKTSVYHYFKSKTEILDAICERASLASTAAILETAPDEPDPVIRLQEKLTAYAAVCLSEPGFAVLMRHLDDVSPPVLVEVTKNGKRVESEVTRTVQDGIAQGLSSAPDPKMASFGMLGSLNYTYSWFRPDGRLPPEEVSHALITLLMDGITSRPRPGAKRR